MFEAHQVRELDRESRLDGLCARSEHSVWSRRGSHHAGRGSREWRHALDQREPSPGASSVPHGCAAGRPIGRLACRWPGSSPFLPWPGAAGVPRPPRNPAGPPPRPPQCSPMVQPGSAPPDRWQTLASTAPPPCSQMAASLSPEDLATRDRLPRPSYMTRPLAPSARLAR